MGTTEVIEFNYPEVEACITDYEAVKVKVIACAERLETLIKSGDEAWSGADAENAKMLLADAHAKIQIIEYNIQVCRKVLANAGRSFAQNEAQIINKMNQAYFG